MSRILCVIDGMTDPHFQVERYGHLASMGSMRYVDTCGGFPLETLHCVLRLLGVTDLDAKTEAALRAAERCPFVLLHINGADEAAHRHDSAEKETFLRRVDDRVLSRLLASEHEIMVASDHGADPESGAHWAAHSLFYQPLNGNSQNMKTA